jgi:hypothetical protein
MLRLKKVVEMFDGTIVDSDLSDSGSVCHVCRRKEVISLVVDSEVWSSWTYSEWPHAQNARWLSEDRIAIWDLPSQNGKQFAVRAFGKGGNYELPVANPRGLVVGRSTIFCAYGEEAYLVAGEDEVESQLVAAFDKQANFLFGLRECLRQGGCDDAIEMETGCVSDNDEGLFKLYPSSDLWSMAPRAASIARVELPAELRGFSAVSAAGNTIYFAVIRAEDLLLISMDRPSGQVREEGTISMSSIGAGDPSYFRRAYRIRGCCNGAMVLMSDKSVWSIRFQ